MHTCSVIYSSPNVFSYLENGVSCRIIAGGIQRYEIAEGTHNFCIRHFSMQLRIGSIGALYNKSLKLVAVGGGSRNSTAGEMSNLASNDVERFLYASLFISYLFWAPVEALAVLCVGIVNLGPAFAAGYVVLFTFVPMQFYLGHRFAISRSEIAAITDQRVNLVSQAIQGVRVMKMSGWELHFAERISKLRMEEVKTIQRASRYRALNEAIFFATNISVAIVIFVVHVLTGHHLTPRDVFTTLTLINLVQFTMTKFFAYSVMSCSECYVSVCRIQQFLELPELPDIQAIRNEDVEGPIMRISGASSYWDSSSAGSETDVSERSCRSVFRGNTGNVSQKSCSSKKSKQRSDRDTTNVENREHSMSSSRRSLESDFAARSIALENISLTLERGRLYCVIGPVGCGKSALLLALAGELEPNVGLIERNATSIAYASQAAWIMDGTVKENILMGKEFVLSQYEEVIDACGLRPDIERFHAGDNTLLGDRGIQCSKLSPDISFLLFRP
jgi:ATP-binding cassette, subfamily C (CFTR/MRP), member 1